MDPFSLMNDRPFLVTIIAILNLLGALAFLVIGLALSAVSVQATCAYGVICENGFSNIMGLILLGVGIADLFITIGLFEGWTFAWWVAIIFAFVGMGSSFSIGANGGYSFGGVFLDIAIVIILLLPSSREFFGIGQ